MYEEVVSGYVSSGVPINGMGIQSHLSGDIDVERIKVLYRRRLKNTKIASNLIHISSFV